MAQSDLVIILPAFLTSNAVGLGIDTSPEYYWRGERISNLSEVPGFHTGAVETGEPVDARLPS